MTKEEFWLYCFEKHVKFRKPKDYPYNKEYDLCINIYDYLKAIEEFRKTFPDRLIG